MRVSKREGLGSKQQRSLSVREPSQRRSDIDSLARGRFGAKHRLAPDVRFQAAVQCQQTTQLGQGKDPLSRLLKKALPNGVLA